MLDQGIASTTNVYIIIIFQPRIHHKQWKEVRNRLQNCRWNKTADGHPVNYRLQNFFFIPYNPKMCGYFV